jgi:hypothetical protein
MDPDERGASIADLARRWKEEFEYFESAGDVAFLGWQEKPWKVGGLGLPADLLADFYSNNARKWFPGLFQR